MQKFSDQSDKLLLKTLSFINITKMITKEKLQSLGNEINLCIFYKEIKK